MESTAPQATPPPSGVTFISIEDFDANFPAPEIGQLYVQNVPPLVQLSTANSSVAVNDKAASESGGSTTSTPDLGSINWIGKLQEYHQIHPRAGKHVFTESSTAGFPRRFVCSVTIGERPEPFSSTNSFGNKKQAKQHCCKLAIEWLVENGHMPSIDSVSFPKHHQVAPLAKAGPGASAVQMTAGAEIAQICFELRMGLPAYVMKNEPAGSPLWSGYAHFPSNHLVDGQVGEFRNVFGKNNAKGDCQLEVLKFLKEIKRDKESTALDDGVKGYRESVTTEGAKEITAIEA
ncbi:hypothetical protein VC83_05282 [Pseudogymnoascus destructans]|uniref:DRBM domain-containing protein n=2 Tax=Pseudogymnoascus destructans TaxID=655981 RepID=L8G1J5_PSED2|nr:uncharacterized protein VC83_05282 [Pseudogymnoascus destructans]ELR06659.1 hypothetical protein GMDG_00276 [Pseudogymnoascus destructans 20631-21]OAF57887.1 hypothetical protein VC83_05282 [Pseudogymnoascus destructans]